ncbi:MAG: FadR family transcriptional regulator, partial [Moraxellaceae bacterium]
MNGLRSLFMWRWLYCGLFLTAGLKKMYPNMQLKKPDFKSLVETRIMLESNIVALAAERRTTQQLIQIEEALIAYQTKVERGESGVEEDLMFHLKISEASGNSVMNTLMLIITPEIITNFEKYHVCKNSMTQDNVIEHL